MSASENTTSTVDAPSSWTWMVSELLCFVSDKCNILPFDDIVKLCADFYTESEIIEARNVIDSLGTRLPKRKQSPDRLRLTMEDITKCILNPTINLPTFYAKNLARLPPVDMSHCDISAILLELRALRAEVRSIGELKAEIVVLKSEVNRLQSRLNANMDSNFPPLPAAIPVNSTHNVTLPSNDASATSSAQIVKQAVTSGALRKTARVKSCVGKASASDKLKTVCTYREVELFVSHVHPSMNENAIVEFVIEALESSSVAANANDALIQCEKLPTKYDMYTS